MFSLSQLESMIASTRAVIGNLTKRKDDISAISPKAEAIQPRLTEAVNKAQVRLNALSSLGVSAALLEDILEPVRHAPDCSGISSALKKGLEDTSREIEAQNSKLSSYRTQKEQLEKEALQK